MTAEGKPTIYQFFEEHGVYMIDNGIITADKFMAYIRYKVYLDFLAQGNSHEQAVIKASARNKCTPWSIWRSIKLMTDPQWRRENSSFRKKKGKVRNHTLPKLPNG